jgi:hypothetical protein
MKTCRRLLTAALFLSLALAASATPHYVDVNGTNATPPYLDWSTAATNIQDAVDVASIGDQVLVTNGVYRNGGRKVYVPATNRVAVTKPVTVQSVNGPVVTTIQGNPVVSGINGGIRCVYLTNGAVLAGFTLINGNNAGVPFGTTPPNVSGAGVWCESSSAIVSNCVLTKNWAFADGGGAFRGTLVDCRIVNNEAETNGAGAAYSTLINCTLSNNTVSRFGGGASRCTLNNCIVVSNTGTFGGGAAYCTLNNSTVVNNLSLIDSGGTYDCTNNNCIVRLNMRSDYPRNIYSNYYGGALNYCCTEPLPASGTGNFTNEPLFVSQPGILRLLSNSPCINAGNNSWAPAGPDLDGNPRIVNGTVDIGAYEFQGSGSLISYAWLQQYGWPTDGSTDSANPDGDGMNNWQEWRADTIPTDALSVLRMITVTNGTPGLQVTWQSVPTRNYWLDRLTELASPPSFSTVASNIAGQVGTTTYADTNAIGLGPFFYRVGVQP